MSAREFGFDGEILVDYAISEEIRTFNIDLPEPCGTPCTEAHGWALSAFASGPWTRGEVS